MKKSYLFLFVLIGLAFTSVGFSEPDVSAKESIQVESVQTELSVDATPFVMDAVVTDSLVRTENSKDSESIPDYIESLSGKANDGYSGNVFRPPTQSVRF